MQLLRGLVKSDYDKKSSEENEKQDPQKVGNENIAFQIPWFSPSEGKTILKTSDSCDNRRNNSKPEYGKASPSSLVLQEVNSQCFVEFGTVLFKNGSKDHAYVARLELVNLSDTGAAVVVLDRINETRGFFLLNAENGWEIPSNSSHTISVYWAPKEIGTLRESICFKFSVGRSRKLRATAYLMGTAVESNDSAKGMKAGMQAKKTGKGPVSNAKTRKEPLRTLSKNKQITNETNPGLHSFDNKNQPITKKASAQAPGPSSTKLRLELESSVVNTQSRRSLAKSKLKDTRSYYDANWLTKQEKGFAAWLNFILVRSKQNSILEFDGKSKTSSNPFAELVHKQRKASIERAAFKLYHGSSMQKTIFLLDREVASEQISIRKDKDLFKDLGSRNQVINMLKSYNGPWLRLGLETVLGLRFKITHGNRDLSTIITHEFLKDPELEEKYRESKIGLFEENPEYMSELRQRWVRRFLGLVLFLDKAKLEGLIDDPRCLFVPASEINSSEKMLIEFSKEFLKGEGNIVKHLLQSCNYSVEHKQSLVDEFDFTVENLCVDLKDGVRLTRAVEILTGNKNCTLSHKLRLPASDKLQKRHNVTLALDGLEKAEQDLPQIPSQKEKLVGKKNVPRKYCKTIGIAADDIVKGSQEKTLLLLWKMITKWKLGALISEGTLRDEITRIAGLHGPTARKILKDSQDQEEVDGRYKEPEVTGIDSSFQKESDERPIKELLLRWAQVVCAHYQVRVSNLTTSLSNGRALCLILHYYHPKLLRYADIKETLVELCSKIHGQEVIPNELDWLEYDTRLLSHKEYSDALKNESGNFFILNKCVNSLGSVPVMLPQANSENPLEEKSTSVFLAYLCSRLLESRDEVGAAKKIQHFWLRKVFFRRMKSLGKRAVDAAVLIQKNTRIYLMSRRLHFLALGAIEERRSIEAASRIQLAVRQFLRRKRIFRRSVAVIRIQTFYRGAQARIRYNSKLNAARTIQRALRLFQAIEKLKCLRARYKSTAKVQAVVRGYLVRKRHQRIVRNAKKVQAVWRGFCARRLRREIKKARLTRGIEALVRIQAIWRRKRVESGLKFIHHAATRIQSVFRLWHCKQLYRKNRSRIILLQSIYRRKLAIRTYNTLRKHRQEEKRIKAATIIQAEVRRHLKMQTYKTLKFDVTRIQAIQRGRSVRKEFQIQNQAATVIQARFRSTKCRRQYLKKIASVALLQSFLRRFLAVNELMRLKKEKEIHLLRVRTAAANKIQYCWHSYRNRKSYARTLASISLLQATFRGFSFRKKFKAECLMATKIQWHYRMYRQRKLYGQMRHSTIRMQRRYRCLLARRFFLRTRASLIKLQALFRGFLFRKNLRLAETGITKLQAKFRSRIAVRERYKKLQSITLIQCFFRGILAKRRTQLMRTQRLLQKSSATRIQSAWRRYLASSHYKALCHKIVFIQSLARRNLVRNRFIRLRASTLLLQRYARRHLLIAIKQRRAISRFQALVRGYFVRKRRSRQLQALQARITKANNAATAKMTLGNRTRSALQWILNSDGLSEILKACVTLELSTAASKECAIEFLESDASDVLFKLIRSCNRSEPHVHVLGIVLKVLTQVSKYDSDSLYVRVFAAEEEAALALVDLIQIFRDKSLVSGLALFLLELYCTESSRTYTYIVSRQDIHRRLLNIVHIYRRRVEIGKVNVGFKKKNNDDIKQYHQLRQLLSNMEKLVARNDQVNIPIK